MALDRISPNVEIYIKFDFIKMKQMGIDHSELASIIAKEFRLSSDTENVMYAQLLNSNSITIPGYYPDIAYTKLERFKGILAKNDKYYISSERLRRSGE